MSGLDLLICPLCGAPLALEGGSFACERRHAFDRAREGYVNLLRTRRTGDSKQMLLARRAFLDRGYYAPLARAVSTIVRDSISPGERDEIPAAILDAGCGEGYYLARIMDELGYPSAQERYAYIGLDSSKEAVRLASKRCKGAFFVVADIQEQPPIADRSLHVLLNIFAPRRIDEFARVLRPDGMLLCVIPAPRHLTELRERLGLLSIEEQKLERLTARLRPDFERIAVQHLAYTMRMGAADLLHLIEMTPNSRHADRWSRAAVEEMADAPISAAFTIVTARRR